MKSTDTKTLHMLQKDLESLTLQDLRELAANETPEGLRLEFKQALTLETKEQKRELARDVSAMANSAGGRIVFGIAERKLEDGSVVAGDVIPLKDHDLTRKAEDILADVIHPRVFLDVREIEVDEGYVLVLDVVSSADTDLHMVEGFDEARYYKRSGQRICRMTEPEIRQAYDRISSGRRLIEQRVQKVLRRERDVFPDWRHHILLVPGSLESDLANPSRLGKIHRELADGPLRAFDSDCLISNMDVTAEGLVTRNDPITFLAIRRDGTFHLARKSPFTESTTTINPLHFIRHYEAVVEAARIVFDHLSFWGKIYVQHELRLQQEAALKTQREPLDTVLPAGEHILRATPTPILRGSAGWEPIARDLMDRLFQAGRRARCPFFDDTGRLIEPWRKTT